jgi:hypothetical protein
LTIKNPAFAKGLGGDMVRRAAPVIDLAPGEEQDILRNVGLLCGRPIKTAKLLSPAFAFSKVRLPDDEKVDVGALVGVTASV